MIERQPAGTNYGAVQDLAMVDSTPPAEGTLNDMLNVGAPSYETPAMNLAHNFDLNFG